MPDLKDLDKVFVRSSEPDDIDYVARHLRDADRKEIQAYVGISPIEALSKGYQHSKKCFTGMANNKPFVMFGAVPVLEDVGSIWLLGTDQVLSNKIQFLRQSKYWLDIIHKDFPLLFNYVDARNAVHIRWLKWLGFKFINLHKSFGVEQLPFYEFVRIK
tara:strand:+ start:321 stop:797 length:477 start_codon:yes stop_codon:yes gene_type:complete